MLERRRFMPYDAAHVAGFLLFDDGEKSYKISRSVSVSTTSVKEAVREQLSVTDLSSGLAVMEGSVPGKVFFGIDEEAFTSSLYITQLSGAQVNGGAAGDALENLLFSADARANTDRAIAKLEDARRELLHKTGNGGEIPTVEREIAKISASLSEVKSVNTTIIAKEGELLDKKKIAETTRDRLDIATRKHAAIEINKKLAAFAELNSAEKSAETKTAEKTACEINGIIPTRDDAISLRDSINKSSELRTKIAEKTSEKKFLTETAYKGTKETKKSASFGFIIASILFFLASVAFYVAFNTSNNSLLLAAAIGMLFTALLFAFTYILNRRKHKNALAEQKEQQKAAEQAKSDKLQALNFELATLNDSLAKYEAEITSAAEKYAFDGGNFYKLAELLEEQSHKAAILDEEISRLRFKAETISKNLAGESERELINALAELNLDPKEELDESKTLTEMKYYKNASDAALAAERSVELELASLKGQKLPDAGELSVKLNELNAIKKASEEKLEALVLAIDCLKEASGKLREGVLPRMEEYAGKIMKALTNDSHDSLNISRDFTLSYDSAGAPRTIDFLSVGARDAAYLSLRLALINLLFGDKKPPVIFDEVFASQDDTRADNLMSVLLSLAKDNVQSIILSCHNRDEQTALIQGANVVKI
jgi:uncharacterized protein YhaN